VGEHGFDEGRDVVGDDELASVEGAHTFAARISWSVARGSRPGAHRVLARRAATPTAYSSTAGETWMLRAQAMSARTPAASTTGTRVVERVDASR
jgi:hypothetical protein